MHELLRPAQGLWGTRLLAIFIDGNMGTSRTVYRNQGIKGILFEKMGNIRHFFLGNIQKIIGNKEDF